MTGLRWISKGCGLALVLLLLAGCASDRIGQWEGPATAAAVKEDGWRWQGESAKCMRTPHYDIYTTIQDDEVRRALPQLMEGAMTMYRQMAPGVAVSSAPMDCYIFRFRNQWDGFTRTSAGPDAGIYLQIRSGGYTVGDRFALYYIGRQSTISVAAHEGWHQFLGRNFTGRLPPFLEEGMACMFESVAWKGDLPRWNLSVNPMRAQELRKAIDGKYLWPLDRLVAMHAGDIVGDRMERIDAFYAEAWAFARFLWEGDNGKYRPALQKLLAETAAGTVSDPTGCHNRAGRPWNRNAVKPMLEHYLGEDLATVDQSFQAYMRKIAYDELMAQWRS